MLGRAVATQSADLAARLRTIAADVRGLHDRLRRASQDSHLIVADTNIYLHGHTITADHDTSVASLPWRQMLDEPTITGQLIVVVPDFVVTELDLRKSRGDQSARRRARDVLRDLYRLFTASGTASFPTTTLVSQSYDGAGDGIDLVFLDTGIITGPQPADVDQALIDLARTCRAFTDTPVHFVSGDLSANLRAQTHAEGHGGTQTLVPHWVDWTP